VTRSATGNSRDRRPSKGPVAPLPAPEIPERDGHSRDPYDRRRVPGWDPNSSWPVRQATPVRTDGTKRRGLIGSTVQRSTSSAPLRRRFSFHGTSLFARWGTGPFPCLSWPILNPRVTHFVQIGTVLICRNDSPLTFCHGAYKRATGSVTRTKAEEYRRLAQECLAMARTVSTEEARADLMTMAQVWHRLANEQDQRSDLAETPAPPPATEQTQPVVQQQQQVQPKDDAKKE
jgi:hypothetical protein